MPRTARHLAATLLAAAGLAVGGLAPVAAADAELPAPKMSGGAKSSDSIQLTDRVPPVLVKARQTAGVVEKLRGDLPLDATFTDSSGEVVRLGDFFTGERPVIIQFAYYRCPQLCGEISKGMLGAMRGVAGDLDIGEDFDVLTISFDSRETPELAAANKQAIVAAMKSEAPEEAVRKGWRCLVGDDLAIKQLADAMGYRFGWVEEAQQYSHPAALVFATPTGGISRYLYGVRYSDQTMRLSIINASEGKITPTLGDAFILNCFDFDPTTGQYTATAYTLMRIAGVTTVLVIVSVVGFLLLMERRGKAIRGKYAGTPTEEYGRDGNDDDDRPRSAFGG